jgi:hypothetical protein
MDELLQADIWLNCTVINFDTLDKKRVKAIVLSNSCDVDLKNSRTLPIKVTFVPLIELKKLEALLLKSKSSDIVTNIIKDIKRQHSTSFFYLPALPGVFEESVAYLIDIHSQPIQSFSTTAKKTITMSMAGFYLFVLKLSMHFCRFNENVQRDSNS